MLGGNPHFWDPIGAVQIQKLNPIFQIRNMKPKERTHFETEMNERISIILHLEKYLS